jgi:hypothetical protein
VPSEDSWQSIEIELLQLFNHEEYKLLRPLLESLQSMIGAKYPSPEIVSGLLEVVKNIQMETYKGANPHEIARQVASGFMQPQWNIQGSVHQANRDFFNQVVIQFFSTNLSELEKTKPNPSILVPIILLVMNAFEAKELASGNALQGYPGEVFTDFKRLQKLLADNQMLNWVQCYHDNPQAWQPFRDSTESIEQLLKRTFSMVEGYQNPIVPVFVDIRTLNKDYNRHALKELRSHGCVVVMDVISMRHPAIQREFRSSLLDAFPKTLVVRVAPINEALQIVQQMVGMIERYIDLECHKRFKLDCDKLSEEASDTTRFCRWLKNEVTNLLPDDAKSQTSSRKHWYQISGVDK